KQINPSIKAYLIRSAFYVLLLVATCVIPFALAQRKTSQVRPQGRLPASVTQSKAWQSANAKAAKANAKAKLKSQAAGGRQRSSLAKNTNQPARARNHFSKAPGLQRPQGDCGIIINGGWETGDFPPWTDTGDTSFTSVVDFNAHSGTFALETGPATSDGFITQTIPTV